MVDSTKMKVVVLFMVGCFLALVLQVYYYSPISSSQSLVFPSARHHLQLPSNSYLQEAKKLGEGQLIGPEDVWVDKKDGILYATTHDGWIKRLNLNNGSLENWKRVNNGSLLGISPSAAGGLIVCDTNLGLLRVTEDGVTVLASQFNGSQIKFADDVIEATDGSLYFSVASTKYGLHVWALDVLEAVPHGQLLKYDPKTDQVSLLLDNLGFANGVALSKDEDYLLVCESWKFRCLKYWLSGDRKGMTEIFVENLPGAPDNINLAPDGSFWIALIQVAPKGFEFMYESRIGRHLIATFSTIGNILQAINKKATVVKVSPDGKILAKYDDPNGKVVTFVTSALEYEGHLYLGSLRNNFVGKLLIVDT